MCLRLRPLARNRPFRLLSVTLALLLSVFVTPVPLHAASAPATSSTAAAIDPLRLSLDVEPLAQSVEPTLDPAKDDFSGRVRIDLLVHATTAAFRLHALGPVFTSASLTNLAGRSLALTATITDAALGLVTLTAPSPIPPGTYALAIAFDNKFNRAGVGTYKTVSRGDPYLYTQFEARDTRRAFPCWDEPSFKIPWSSSSPSPRTLRPSPTPLSPKSKIRN